VILSPHGKLLDEHKLATLRRKVALHKLYALWAILGVRMGASAKNGHNSHAALTHLGDSWGTLARCLGPLGRYLDVVWTHLGASWATLGAASQYKYVRISVSICFAATTWSSQER
jgi:hypothetical protein